MLNGRSWKSSLKRSCVSETGRQQGSLELRVHFPGKMKRLESSIRGCLACLKIMKEASVAKAKTGRDEITEIMRDLVGWCQNCCFYSE